MTQAASRPRLGHLVVGSLLIVVGGLWMLESVADVEVPWEALLPGALVIVGAALVYGSTTGSHGGLIVLGVALSVVVVFASALSALVEVPLRGGIGEQVHRPVAAEGPYRWAIGTMTLDLRDATLPDEVRATVGIGELVVIVPSGAAVEVRSSAGIGEVVVFGESSAGLGPELSRADPEAQTRIVAQVGLGKVEVKRG